MLWICNISHRFLTYTLGAFILDMAEIAVLSQKVFQMTNAQRIKNFQRWEKMIDRKFNLKEQRQTAWLKEIEEVAQ